MNNWALCYVVGLSSLSKVKNCFLFLSWKGGYVFAAFFAPVPEKEVLDFIAHGWIIQVLPVGKSGAWCLIGGMGCGDDISEIDFSPRREIVLGLAQRVKLGEQKKGETS